MMRPEVGLYRPVSMLNSVVLPAPLGPITDTIERSGISSETPPTAVGPPEAGAPGAHLTAASLDTTATSQTVKSGAAPSAAELPVERPGLTPAG